MKLQSIKFITKIMILTLSVTFTFARAETTAPASKTTTQNAILQTADEKLSYTLALDIGTNFKNQNVNIHPEAFMLGLKDGLNGNTSLVKKDDMNQALSELQENLIAKREAEFVKISEENLRYGEEFLAKNRKKIGVKETPDGLQYRILKRGSGTSPEKDDVVTVEYIGRALDGTIFDQSQPGAPVTFPVSEVIPGWTKALMMMKPGAIWEIFLPPALAYGENGSGGTIGPNQTLIFKVRLVSFEKLDSKATADDASE